MRTTAIALVSLVAVLALGSSASASLYYGDTMVDPGSEQWSDILGDATFIVGQNQTYTLSGRGADFLASLPEGETVPQAVDFATSKLMADQATTPYYLYTTAALGRKAWEQARGTYTINFGKGVDLSAMAIQYRRNNAEYGFLGFENVEYYDGVQWISLGSTPHVLKADALEAQDRYEFQIDDTAHALRLSYNINATPGSHLKVDYLDIYAVPEPGTTLLLGAGGMIAAFRRRR